MGIFMILVASFTSIAALKHSVWNSCDLAGNTGCRRCDCVPDCVDLSDERNCTYGNIDGLFMSLDFVLEHSKDKTIPCDTEKFFSPPPLPPFSMCNEHITTTPFLSTSPPHSPSTAIPQPPSTQPEKPESTTQSSNRLETTTNQNRQFTPPTVPTTSRAYGIEKIKEFSELCHREYRHYSDVLMCTRRLWLCLTNPYLCPKPTIPTTTTTTMLRPRPVYPIVTPYYYDYYTGYDAWWNWNYLI